MASKLIDKKILKIWNDKKMWKDSIVEEVRKTREAHAAKFNYNLDAIYRDLKKQEKRGGRKTVSFQAHQTKTASRRRKTTAPAP